MNHDEDVKGFAVAFKAFIRNSGFKVLAMARLTQCEYSIVLYIINCSASGLDQFITTEEELASLIGFDHEEIRSSLENLASRHIIKIHYGDTQTQNLDHQSLRVGLEYNLSHWHLDFTENATSSDAIVFPFRRIGQVNLTVLPGRELNKHHEKGDREEKESDESTWERVAQAFFQGRSFDDQEWERAYGAAKILVETHPVDQVLLMIRHFKERIPTLSLLASSWQHYQELFENETQKVDLLDARLKHKESDHQLREKAREILNRAEGQTLTDEEVTVLNILISHRHPRRQLFWAYQLRSRYPHLEEFFNDNKKYMLPVTTKGSVWKVPPHENPNNNP